MRKLLAIERGWTNLLPCLIIETGKPVSFCLVHVQPTLNVSCTHWLLSICRYVVVSELVNDFELILRNCHTFNSVAEVRAFEQRFSTVIVLIGKPLKLALVVWATLSWPRRATRESVHEELTKATEEATKEATWQWRLNAVPAGAKCRDPHTCGKSFFQTSNLLYVGHHDEPAT
eukprot:SAG31_NODE_13890_length_839_cov_1.252703_2_plen_174_part_00